MKISKINFAVIFLCLVLLSATPFYGGYEFKRIDADAKEKIINNNLLTANSTIKNLVKKQNDLKKQIEESEKKEYLNTDIDSKNKHPIDIEEEKCIKSSGTFDYPNCAYNADIAWSKEIEKNLKLLKTNLKDSDFNKVKKSQSLWEKSIQEDKKLIDEYIESQHGLVGATLAHSLIAERKKQRASFLSIFGLIYENN